MTAPPRNAEERVLIYAPFGRDAELTRDTLRANDVLAEACATAEELFEGVAGGAAAIAVTEEALDGDTIDRLIVALERQDPWSDLPIVVFTREGDGDRSTDRLASRFDVTRVERPVRMATLLSVVRAALRARRRQYEVRTLLGQLEETDRRKDQFLAMLGHELRNPLAAIRTAVDMLAESDDEPVLVDRAREVINRQTANLSRMVDDLLDVSRITQGKVNLKLEAVDLGELAERCVKAFEVQARGGGQELAFEPSGDDLFVRGDPVRLEQIVSNLVSNALKYSGDGGHIRVRVRAREDRLLIVVRDNGIGIAPDMQPKVFDAFTQVDASVERARGGLGLGLPVVRALVELHGGTVHVFSEGANRGSEFVVRLPRLPSSTERPTRAPQTPRAPRREVDRTVLIIDDDQDIRTLVSTMLQRWGWRVSTAGDGETGLRAIETGQPSVALVDIGMPVMDGYALAKRVQTLDVRQRPLLVAMTGYGQPEDRRRAADAGFEKHLTKPVESAELRRVLEALVETRVGSG